MKDGVAGEGSRHGGGGHAHPGMLLEIAEVGRIEKHVHQQLLEVEVEAIPELGQSTGLERSVGIA